MTVLRLSWGRYEVRPIFGRFLLPLPLDRRLALSCMPRASFDCSIGDSLTLCRSQGLTPTITGLCLGFSARGALPVVSRRVV